MPVFAETITVSVEGMHCINCVMALTETFEKQDAVQSVDITLENGLVTLETKDDMIFTDKTIRDLITRSGYEVTGIKR